QRDVANIPDPDPEIERRSFQMAEGFEVNLFAADPLLAKPIQMNFDAAGRLWVACSEVYPQIKPGQKANDKIIVLEDTKGAGRADKTTVFADGLLIPTGVEPGDGGVVWQFRPETMQLDVFLRGFCNPWGHHFDRWGQSFVTDGAFGEGINYGLPGASYVFAQPAIRILAGLNPGSPKHCGLEIVSGRHLPPDWQGNMITNDFRGHRVCRFVVSEDGAGYASREKRELSKSNHP